MELLAGTVFADTVSSSTGHLTLPAGVPETGEEGMRGGGER